MQNEDNEISTAMKTNYKVIWDTSYCDVLPIELINNKINYDFIIPPPTKVIPNSVMLWFEALTGSL